MLAWFGADVLKVERTTGNGQLIGMNSANASLGSTSGENGSVGLGFAIPVAEAKRIADELIATGTASRGFLGARLTDDPNGGGARIVDVASGGPAAAAGVAAGALVTRVDGQSISNAEALIALNHLSSRALRARRRSCSARIRDSSHENCRQA